MLSTIWYKVQQAQQTSDKNRAFNNTSVLLLNTLCYCYRNHDSEVKEDFTFHVITSFELNHLFPSVLQDSCHNMNNVREWGNLFSIISHICCNRQMTATGGKDLCNTSSDNI